MGFWSLGKAFLCVAICGLFQSALSRGQDPSLGEDLLNESISLEALNNRMQNGLRSEGRSLQCFEKYQEAIYRGVLNIMVVFGYNDNEDGLTSDEFERAALIAEITKPCRSNQLFACGFQSARGGGLEKVIDEVGRKILVHLELENSSFSIVDRDNKNEFAEPQREKSLNAETAFIRGLLSFDAAFYVGHSRAGGGPDFRPPRYVGKGITDYNWYRAREAGLKLMVQAIKKSQIKSQFIGLFSCDSNRLFGSKLHIANPQARLLLSNNLSHFGYFNQALLGALDAVIGFKCEEAFQDSLLIPGVSRRLVRLHHF